MENSEAPSEAIHTEKGRLRGGTVKMAAHIRARSEGAQADVSMVSLWKNDALQGLISLAAGQRKTTYI